MGRDELKATDPIICVCPIIDYGGYDIVGT